MKKALNKTALLQTMVGNIGPMVVFIIGAVLYAFTIGLLIAWPTSLLWNYCLIPAVTILKPVTILQMWGINILFTFLGKVYSKS